MHLFEYGHAGYKKEGTYACSNMVRRHTATSWVGQKIKKKSEINHVEDQNGVYSTLNVHMSKIHPH